MNRAQQLLRRMNRNAFLSSENGYVVGLEDVSDPDGRLYRLEYRSTPDGTRAIVFCLHNPWQQNPYDYLTSHLRSDGLICIGAGEIADVENSPVDLHTAILRARYWTTGFSYLIQHGYFPQP